MADIEGMLKTTSSIGTSAPGSRKSLEPKQELLSILLENERSRLKVWLSPLDVEKRHYLSSGSGSRGPSEVSQCDPFVIGLIMDLESLMHGLLGYRCGSITSRLVREPRIGNAAGYQISILETSE